MLSYACSVCAQLIVVLSLSFISCLLSIMRSSSAMYPVSANQGVFLCTGLVQRMHARSLHLHDSRL